MIFAQNDGHCLKGPDAGAEGCGYKEQNLTRLVGNLVTSKLIARGHIVIPCTVNAANNVNSALNTIALLANIQKVDLFFSMHFNASNGQGHGTEVYTYGAKQLVQATNILKNIVGLGYANRGIKDGSHLSVIRNTKAPSMLIECCFIDNVGDMKIFNSEKMADAIVNGLIGQVAVSAPPLPKVDYCKEFQEFYNKVTQTSAPLELNGYGPLTQKAYEAMGKLIKK